MIVWLLDYLVLFQVVSSVLESSWKTEAFQYVKNIQHLTRFGQDESQVYAHGQELVILFDILYEERYISAQNSLLCFSLKSKKFLNKKQCIYFLFSKGGIFLTFKHFKSIKFIIVLGLHFSGLEI